MAKLSAAKASPAPTNRNWGAARVRMVSRLDKVVNFARRGRETRQSHVHHHDKTKRMQH